MREALAFLASREIARRDERRIAMASKRASSRSSRSCGSWTASTSTRAHEPTTWRSARHAALARAEILILPGAGTATPVAVPASMASARKRTVML